MLTLHKESHIGKIPTLRELTVCLPPLLSPRGRSQRLLGSRKLGFWFWLCQNTRVSLGKSFPSFSLIFIFSIIEELASLLLGFGSPPLPPLLEPPTSFSAGCDSLLQKPWGTVSFLPGRERSKIIYFLITQLRLGSNLHFKVLLIRV